MVENHQKSLKNHWELLKNHLTITQESWESARIAKNHWKLLENQWETWESINHWESLENQQEWLKFPMNHLRISENCSELLKNHWERISKNHENCLRIMGIAKNDIKTIRSYLFNSPQTKWWFSSKYANPTWGLQTALTI